MSQLKARSVPSAGKSPSDSETLQKELRDKLAWSVGSAFKRPYSGRNNPIMVWANRLASQIVDSHSSQQEKSASRSDETTRMERKGSAGNSFHGFDAPAKKPF